MRKLVVFSALGFILISFVFEHRVMALEKRIREMETQEFNILNSIKTSLDTLESVHPIGTEIIIREKK